MTKNITRTFKHTTVFFANVYFENGQPVAQDLPSIDFLGDISEEKALKSAKKVYPEAQALIVKGMELIETTYAMPVEQFIELAHVVEPKTEEVE